MIYHHAAHALSMEDSIHLDDLDLDRIWLLEDGHCFRHQVVNFCDIKDAQADGLPYNYQGGSIDTLMKIINNEGGFTLIPELAADPSSKQVKRFSRKPPLREVSLVYNRKFVKSKLIDRIAANIKKNIPAYMLDSSRGTIVPWR